LRRSRSSTHFWRHVYFSSCLIDPCRGRARDIRERPGAQSIQRSNLGRTVMKTLLIGERAHFAPVRTKRPRLEREPLLPLGDRLLAHPWRLATVGTGPRSVSRRIPRSSLSVTSTCASRVLLRAGLSINRIARKPRGGSRTRAEIPCLPSDQHHGDRCAVEELRHNFTRLQPSWPNCPPILQSHVTALNRLPASR
jgi:hypothetical protein